MISLGSGLWLPFSGRERVRTGDGQKLVGTDFTSRTNLATVPIPIDFGTAWQSNNGAVYPRTYVDDPQSPGGRYVRLDCRSGTVVGSAYAVGHLWVNTGEGTIPVSSGATYTCSIYANHFDQPLQTRLNCSVYDSSGTSIQGPVSGAVFTNDGIGGWGRVWQTFTTTAAGYLRIGVSTTRVDGGTATGNYAGYAGALIEEGTALRSWFCGDYNPSKGHTVSYIQSGSRKGSTMVKK